MLLVSTLDSTLRTMDPENGQLFQTYRGHKNESYRAKATFGNGEAMIVFGDEDGKIWTWDVESVCPRSLAPSDYDLTAVMQGKVLSTTVAHDRSIMWTTHHPTEGQTITASSDGMIKVWSRP